MKRSRIIPLLMLGTLLAGCAARYHDLDILHDQPAAPTHEKKIGVEIKCDPLKDKNYRYHYYMIRNYAQVFQITVSNHTDSNFYFSKGNLVLSQDSLHPFELAAVDAESVKKLGLAAWPYWFWSPLILFIDWIPIPLGVLIGATQFTKAIKNNDAFRLDLLGNMIKNLMVPPHRCVSGLVLVNTRKKDLCFIGYRCILKDVKGAIVYDAVIPPAEQPEPVFNNPHTY